MSVVSVVFSHHQFVLALLYSIVPLLQQCSAYPLSRKSSRHSRKYMHGMASGGANSTNNGSSGNNDDAITINLTYAALAISIGAFILSTLQALLAYLQFDNSEVGRRRCSEEVMGELWAGKTTRKFKWREWRYQVFFEVPVFYTAPPGYLFALTYMRIFYR